ncbi:unnamed protein product [Peniophora sp. CBMAI 1063]|nr:unnamed protein product [Peniophora sp. CBMAI 1063]
MNGAIRAAREHNARAPINRSLSNELLCAVFIALSQLDSPSMARPQGWYPQVTGVCHLWREVALHVVELWADCVGAFPSERITNLVLERAGMAADLSFSGCREDQAGTSRVLTDYQLSLIEVYVGRVRSLVHDEFTDWRELFRRAQTFPRLQTARIWDDSGSDGWAELISAPCLRDLYMNNVLIPFDASALRYLRVDMDNPDYRLCRDVYAYEEPEPDEALPGTFPTREFIAFFQRSPRLEHVVIKDMPQLLADDLPSAFKLHADLPHLHTLHLGGKSLALGDLLQRMNIPSGAQIFVDTDYLDGSDDMDPLLLDAVHLRIVSAEYDSFRLGMTPSFDLMLQVWSSGERDTLNGLDLESSLEMTDSARGPAFTLRLPVGTRQMLDDYMSGRPLAHSRDRLGSAPEDPGLARDFYPRASRAVDDNLSNLALNRFDFTDMPFVVNYEMEDWFLHRYMAFLIGGFVNWKLRARQRTLSWSLLKQMPINSRAGFLAGQVEEVVLVNFPCAAFPSQKRYDREVNEEAWDMLCEWLENREARFDDDPPPFSFKLAESDSVVSTWERSEEPEYVHTIRGSYEDAVIEANGRGYQRVRELVTSFEDLRMNTWS